MTTRLREPVDAAPLKEQADQEYEAFINRLSVKTRAAEQKRAERTEASAESGYGILWRRLAVALDRAAPYATESAGHQALKFHIPDGKYRQQVFALEETSAGMLSVFMPDISAPGMREKLLVRAADGIHFRLVSGRDQTITVDVITSDTPDMAVCKPMLGWGRRALRASIPVNADDAQIRATERLCELGCQSWTSKPPPEKV